MNTTTTIPASLSKKEIEKRARRRMGEGAVTPDYPLERDVACSLLNEALATELMCILRYKRHFYIAQGIRAKAFGVNA